MERVGRVTNYKMGVVRGFESIRGTFNALKIYINTIVF
jgi:hypothetical protein